MFHAKYQSILASGSWEEDFLRFNKIFLILPLIGTQKRPAPLFEQIWIHIPQAFFPPSLVEIGQVVHEKKIFKSFCYVSLYKIMSPKGVAVYDPTDFISTNLNLLAPRMFHAKYQSFPASGSWEEDFLRFNKIFLILPLIGPQRGPAPFYKQIWIPIPQSCFPPSLVEIGQVVREKKSFKGKSQQTNGRRTNCDGNSSLEPSA